MSDSRFADSDRSTPADSPGKSPFAPGSPFAQYYLPPRLGIIHLLAWTAATAVLLKFSMAMEMIGDMGGGSLPPVLSIVQQVIDFIYTMAQAAAFVGTGILLLAKIHRRPGRLQPGHWLLLIGTAKFLLSLLGWAVLLLASAAHFAGYTPDGWIRAVDGPIWITCAGMYFYATWATKDGKRWRVCLGALAAIDLTWGLAYFTDSPFVWRWLQDFIPFGSLIAGLLLSVTLVIDLRRSPGRDWLHWVGVVIVAAAVLQSAAVSWL